MIDLNDLPPDLNALPNDDVEFVQPAIFTQPNTGHGLIVDVDVNMQSESLTLEETNTTVAGPTETELRAGAVGGDQNAVEEDEAGSQPMEPFVGMRFDSLKGAYDHYNDYALRLGFSIKMNTSRRNTRTNILEKQQFACNKFRKPKEDDVGVELPPVLDPIPDPKPLCEEGEMEEVPIFQGEESEQKKNKKKRKRERIKQTECKAKMLVKLKDGRWEVTHFVRDHTHPLVAKPSLSKYLRSHQGIPAEEKRFLEILHNCNLTSGRMMHIMSEFYGSELNVPYGPKAITNLCAGFRKDSTKEGDIIETIAHFKDLQKDDPNFFYKIKYDLEGRAENIFWVDGLARKAYAEAYHDCVSFDTTYMTNMYNMPFAPFIGINRHGQSFMLGCAFVRQEMETSFDWVFETFLEAMNGRAPDNIITDQDVAMKESIKNIFPTTVHRCCRWHIMKKAQEKVGWLLGRNPGLSEDFNLCVDFSFTPDQFEQNWAALMLKYEAITHTHFEKLYEYRNTWVPCYFKHRFFPFLQSTQRSEGFNAVLKRYVNPHKSILNFVKQYHKIQTHILVKEGCNDYRTDHLDVDMWSPFPIEKQAYKTYTRDLYCKFRDEFEMIGRYNAFQVGAEMFELRPNTGWVLKYGSRNYLVMAKITEGQYSCECCKMERDGILCCHILKVFTHIGLDVIPEQYMLKRWTPIAVPSVPSATSQLPDVMPPQSLKEIRHANMTADFQKLAKFASGSDASKGIVDKHMRAARTEIVQLNKSRRKKRAAREAGPSAGDNNQDPPAPPTSTWPNAAPAPTGHAPPPPPMGRGGPPPSMGRGGRGGPPPSMGRGGRGSPHVSVGNASTTLPMDNTTQGHPMGHAQQMSPTSNDNDDAIPRDPPKSTTKGRSRSRRYHSAIELHPKRKNKCSFCNSDKHNAASCSAKLA